MQEHNTCVDVDFEMEHYFDDDCHFTVKQEHKYRQVRILRSDSHLLPHSSLAALWWSVLLSS